MNLVLMLAAFLAILGVALAFQGTLKTNIGEGMFLSVALIVLCLFLGGLAENFSYGMYLIFAISAVGWLVTAYRAIKDGRQVLVFCRAPYFIIVACFFLFCLFAYHNDFIQHIDEFHHWAYAVKYMLEHNMTANHSALFGTTHPYAASLFYLFFQKITGYREQNMYVASSLLVWIGLMLPFSECRREEWKKALLYALIMYFGLYSLYSYGIKNLYVDLPVCAWAGGLAGWWMNRVKKKSNLMVLLSGLVMIWYFKWQAGPLIAVFALAFIVVHTIFIEKDIQVDEALRRKILRTVIAAGVLLVIATAAAGICLLKVPNVRTAVAQLTGNGLSAERIKNTVSTFVTAVVGRPLASKSDLKIAFVPFLVGIGVLMKLDADMHGEKSRYKVYLQYELASAAFFMAVLLFAFLSLFNADEADRMAGAPRYFSLYAIYIAVIALTWLMQSVKTENARKQEYLALGLLLIFLSGLNQKFIPNVTSLNSTEVKGYKEITNSRKQAGKIEKELTAADRVYFLDQKGKNEFAKTTALYYLEEQVSNYIVEPWKFTPEGNMTRLTAQETPGITELPRLLAEGGYTYLWVYKTDDYLKEELPEVLTCEDEIESGTLYRVVYADGSAVGLENVW